MNVASAMPDAFDPLRDLAPAALAIAGVRDDPALRAAGPRSPIEAAATAGFRAVALDASAPGLRPRDMDRSARRDLAALLRRLELAFAGIDLWIPPEHFASPEHADRAAGAVEGAIDLAADLSRDALGAPGGGGRAVVSLTLPRGVDSVALALCAGVLSGLSDRADRAGVTLADHSLPLGEAPGVSGGDSPLRVGIDPAAILLRGGDPVAQTGSQGARVALARWTDADAVSRVPPARPGKGRLDLLAYAATVASATPAGRLVVDVRGVPTPLASARALARTLP